LVINIPGYCLSEKERISCESTPPALHSAAMHETDSNKGEDIPILLLKTKSIPNDGYEEQFCLKHEGFSFAPVFVPVLEHKLLEDGLTFVRDLLHDKLIGRSSGSKYGGIIFTSQRAVEAFAKLVEEGNGAPFH